jgi:UDP-N-acetylglucosamine--N-acetylmuramyl-(pentapeptide) pyrophosphoryl-undecaprenol N-acetylglucosamine transferase
MKIVIAGGGTGGHVFPGVAIAEEVRARDPDATVTFVGTARGLEAKVVPELGWPLELVDMSGLKTVGAVAALRGAARLPRAVWQARRLVRRLAPDVVVGVGGYASVPVVVAARLAGVPACVCEQNSIPGLANRMLGRVARQVFVAFADSARFFAANKVAVVGNPVRRDMVRRLLAPAPPRDDDRVHVLVCGGSQGAVAVNELAGAALVALSAERPLAIVHQAGARDAEATAARYAAAGVVAEVHAFITDMASAYLAADLVIGRAGATTVAELAIAGKAAVLVPYPHAADNHQ